MKRGLSGRFPGVVLLALLAVSPAWAGGLILYEQGTPDVGLASAGFASRAQDASTVFTNPAGMTRLQGTGLMAGAQTSYTKVWFDPDAATGPQTGDNGGSATGWIPEGSLFFTQQAGENLAFGIGAFSYFAGVVDYDDGWVGRYFTRNTTLFGITVMPAAAVRIVDGISIGAGLNAMYGYLKFEEAVRNPGDGGDASLTIKDRVWGYGADVGVLFEIGKGTRIGVTYLSQVALDFEDTPEGENIGPGLAMALAASNLANASLDIRIKVPQSVMVGIYQELGERFALMANAGWQDWSSFWKGGAGPASAVLPVADTTFHDTWHAALGCQFRPSKAWTLSTGAAYDSSMSKNEDRIPSLPVGAARRYGIGTQYAVSEKLTLGLDYELIWSGDLDLDRTSISGGRLSGTYEDRYSHVFAVNVVLGM